MTKKQNEGAELIRANDLRDKLKRVLQQEIERLPDMLNNLEPKDRLQFTLKLLPLLVARPEPVQHTEGEPFSFNF